MGRFDGSRDRRGSRSSGRDFGSRGRSNSRSDNRGRRDRRDSRAGNRERREIVRTKVTCSSCGKECEVPFKPTSSKPVYCDACFEKGKENSKPATFKDIDAINEKLDKILKALKVK